MGMVTLFFSSPADVAACGSRSARCEPAQIYVSRPRSSQLTSSSNTPRDGDGWPLDVVDLPGLNCPTGAILSLYTVGIEGDARPRRPAALPPDRSRGGGLAVVTVVDSPSALSSPAMRADIISGCWNEKLSTFGTPTAALFTVPLPGSLVHRSDAPLGTLVGGRDGPALGSRYPAVCLAMRKCPVAQASRFDRFRTVGFEETIHENGTAGAC